MVLSTKLDVRSGVSWHTLYCVCNSSNTAMTHTAGLVCVEAYGADKLDVDIVQRNVYSVLLLLQGRF